MNYKRFKSFALSLTFFLNSLVISNFRCNATWPFQKEEDELTRVVRAYNAFNTVRSTYLHRECGKYLNSVEALERFDPSIKRLDEIYNITEYIKRKMVIDAKNHNYKLTDNCQERFEACEPGYTEAMVTAWDYMIRTIKNERKLDGTLFQKLHDVAVKGVDISDGGRRYYKHIPPGYDKLLTGPGPNRRFAARTNSLGLTELDRKIHDKLWANGVESKYMHHVMIAGHGEFNWSDLATDITKDFEACKCVDEFFESYYSDIEKLEQNKYLEGSFLPKDSSMTDKKLELIIRTCQDLEQLHLFSDGNLRTIAFLVMNKMLIENGLYPTCMWNPNYLDLYDIVTIIYQVKMGQLHFYKLLHGEEIKRKDFDNYFISDIQRDSKIIDFICGDMINNKGKSDDEVKDIVSGLLKRNNFESDLDFTSTLEQLKLQKMLEKVKKTCGQTSDTCEMLQCLNEWCFKHEEEAKKDIIKFLKSKSVNSIDDIYQYLNLTRDASDKKRFLLGEIGKLGDIFRKTDENKYKYIMFVLNYILVKNGVAPALVIGISKEIKYAKEYYFGMRLEVVILFTILKGQRDLRDIMENC